MSSLHTNAAAMTALQTLASTNKSLGTTQNRISTGYRVAEAADNAAYWSIATTMRSDNKALSTVQDALGLGAAKVDTAYTGLNSAIEVVDKIKTKLVASLEPGVDKAKVQSEIDQLKEQLTSISNSASFNGQNWLSVDSAATGYDAVKKLVSSFTRDGSGNVSVGTTAVDTSRVALFDASAAGDGILETKTAAKLSVDGFSYTQGTLANGDTIDIDIAIDGAAAATYNVTVADAANFDLDDLATGLNTALGGAATAENVNGKLVITSATTGSASSIEITAVSTTQADATTAATIGFTTAGPISGVDGVADVDVSSASSEQISAFLDAVDGMLTDMTTAASDLGAVKSRIDMQKDFASKLMDAIDRGVGQLVDADMTEESARLSALQVQQQLGIQALSIANSSAQNLLSLFR